MRHSICLCLTLLFALNLAGPASAQGVWRSVADASQTVAAGCVPGSPDGHPGLCLAVGCPAGVPRVFMLTLTGDAHPATVEASVSVDGRSPFAIHFVGLGDPPAKWAGKFDRNSAPALLEQLKSGRQAAVSVTLAPGTVPVVRALALSGSSRAIAPVEAACPLAPPPPVADPAAEALAQITTDCTELGGVVAPPGPDFATKEDLDGDGTPDLVINYAGAECSTAATLYCGSAGCTHAIWRGVPGGYVLSYSVNYYEMTPNPDHTLTLQVHSSFCGKSGVEECVKTYRWRGDGLVEKK